MGSFKKPSSCKGCNEPVSFSYKQIEKGKTSCYGLCSKCPLKQNLLDQKIETVSCSSCSKSLEDLQTSGTVGCLDCYTTFKETCHTLFKALNLSEFSPAEQNTKIDIQELQSSLQEAIAKELFEEAALIRDRLKKITTTLGGT
jgi:protein-arginine kinase activator protein McsA